MTLAELITYTRDITGIYSTDLLPDTLLTRWLQESYSEFNRSHDWPWMATLTTGTLAAGETVIPVSNGNGRTREVTLTYPDGIIYQVPTSKSLLLTDKDDDGIFYDHELNGDIVLSKPATKTVIYHVNYIKTAPLLQITGTATVIPSEYEGVLAYRAAIKVLNSQADDSPRANAYRVEYETLLDNLHLEYTVDEDLGPVQIGGEILRTDGRTIGRLNTRYRGV